MKFNKLLTDDDAVSPVIGVILMVAITVILAAVIAGFVLGLGGAADAGKRASFSFDLDDSGDGFNAGDGNDEITITHRSGDSIDKSQLAVVVDGTYVDGSDLDEWGTTVTAGGTETITDSTVEIASSDTVRIVWSSPTDDKTATLESTTVP